MDLHSSLSEAALIAGPRTFPADDPNAVLARIEDRVLWLAIAMVDHANNVRPHAPGPKVGGHQASSASIATIMTALWFGQLRPEDRVSVKPHASPVLHAIEFLLGDLPADKLGTLREFGGLQSYPSRNKDPVPADYSTGSVGIGATAPVWGALARRYVGSHFGPQAKGRQYSLVGDAELDEGACWEAILDPAVAGLGEVVWIVDLNRQSLDRVVPRIETPRLAAMFDAAGWQVLTVKFGRQLEDIFSRRGGDALRTRIDGMSNPEYQRLVRCDGAELRQRLAGGAGSGPAGGELTALLADIGDDELKAAFRNLGGHDLAALQEAFGAIDDTRPTVIFAYTLKGHRLASEGHPQNHSQLLDAPQLRLLAEETGADVADPWAGFGADSPEGRLCSATREVLRRDALPAVPELQVPADLGRTPSGILNTQAAVGRTLLDLNRESPEVSQRIVTVSPDVSSSTNLAGWVNKVGVWSQSAAPDWFSDDTETILHWRESPVGRHIELGIAETNLVGLLGELGATWNRWNQPLIPIGVLYDPFVERALEPWAFGIYAGGQSILIGTPSGVSLAAEGGAHQSIKTPSIGLEQPGCVSYEPAFALDAEWTLLAAMSRLGRPGGSSAYLRLSTRPVDQALAEVPADAAARERRRRHVVAGAYALRRAELSSLTIATMGALVPEALEAADRLQLLGFGADVLVVTSPDLLFRALCARRGNGDSPSWILDSVFPVERATPMVTVLDGHPHALAFLATVNQVAATHLGVTGFGQSGDIEAVYRYHHLDADSIVAAGLDLVD